MNKYFSLILTLALLPGCCGKKSKKFEPKEAPKSKRTVVKEVTPADVSGDVSGVATAKTEAEANSNAMPPMTEPEGPFVYEEEITVEPSQVAMPEEDL